MGIYDSTVSARSRNTELLEISLNGEMDLPVGFGERFSHANKLTYQRNTNPGRASLFEIKARQRDEILIQNGLSEGEFLTTDRLIWRSESGNFPLLDTDDFDHISQQKRDVLGIPDFDEYLRDNEQYDELLNDLIAAHPELGILSDNEILSQIEMDQFELLHRDEELAERSTWLGKAGFLTGSMIGWLRDPVNSVSSLMGLSPVGRLSMSQNFLRVGVAEASLATILEIRNKPSEFEFRKKFGEPDLTVSQIKREALVNVGASFVLGGAIGSAIGRFFPTVSNLPLPEARTSTNAVNETTQMLVNEVRVRQAAGQSFDIEIEQAADLLEETLSIARNAPKDTSYDRHMANYASARKAIADGLDIKGPDDLTTVTRGSDQDVLAPAGSQSINANITPDMQDIAITDLRTQLDEIDVLIRGADEQGVVGTISSRELLADLDSQDAAVRATIDCLG